jgi:tetratricopeptide (TPR) repeat protein
MMILRRHGENRQASPLVETAAECKDFSPVLKGAIRRMRDSIQREKKHQTEAAECFERAILSNQVTGKNRAPACYLLGELNRRMGRDQEAVRWYDQALEAPDIDDQLKTWAGQQRAWAECRSSP